ncbi:MAG: DUF3500 domain-containing protein [Verrucomicrobia bacterium]|nr:DUF3500 domain-containing protein [Verrucomicrobiota bacterium]
MKSIFLSLSLLLTPFASAHEGHSPSSHADAMAAAADTFLDTLNDEQKAKAVFEFKNDERENWHFVPLDRKGIILSDLQPAQQTLAFGLLGSALSTQGLLRATSIMSLEQFLAVRENNPVLRNPQKYYVAIFGTPKPGGTWGWRFEGHHLSVNVTVANGKALALTPIFFGTNPAEITEGPRKGLRPLGNIEDLGRSLATSLKAAGKPVVFTDKAPDDIITGQERAVTALEVQGVTTGDMDNDQRAQLRNLIIAYLDNHPADAIADTVAEMKAADLGKIHFAWAGGLNKGDPHYFRVQGETFLMEYANTQNNANHAHAVWRDFKNDFGRDLLKEHLEAH